MERLIVAEKNQAAYRIARLLAPGQMKRESIVKTAVYEFERDEIRNRVIGLRGHILALDYPEEFNSWQKIAPRELIDIVPLKRREERAIIAALEQLAPTADEVVIATDYDREGELIGNDALNIITAKNPKIISRRARFSALTKYEVEEAFRNLGTVDVRLALSAETRQQVDLVWGATLTRFISLESGQMGGDFLSAGRVQTPTLALIVDREEEIVKFVPEPYWTIAASLRKGTEDDGTAFTADHTHGTFKVKDEADVVMEHVHGVSHAVVSETPAVEEKSEYPPPPFNTTGFLTAATSMGLSAPRAMSIAERLYTAGYISYPRTDNTVYPRSINLRTILERLKESEFREDAEEILSQESIRPSRGRSEDKAHPPIHPSGAATKKDVRGDDWRVYELIVRRFLATVAPPARSESTTAKLTIGPEAFVAKAYRMLYLGWRKYYPYFRFNEMSLPQLTAGERVPVVEIKLEEQKTRPPARYNQGALIQEMERLGLGTKATRHEIIQKLYSRGFVENRNPQPTPSGMAVIETLEQYAKVITEPKMTATLEADMEAIAEGRKEPVDVLSESREMLHQAFVLLEQHRVEIATALRASIRAKEVLGPCPVCGKELLAKRSPRGKRFVGCSGYPACTRSYPLPQRGKLVTMPEACPTCRAPQVKILTQGRRPWQICVNMECPARVAKAAASLAAKEAREAARAEAKAAKAAAATPKAKTKAKAKAGPAARAPKPSAPAKPVGEAVAPELATVRVKSRAVAKAAPKAKGGKRRASPKGEAPPAKKPEHKRGGAAPAESAAPGKTAPAGVSAEGSVTEVGNPGRRPRR